jgi:hypothetical protein
MQQQSFPESRPHRQQLKQFYQTSYSLQNVISIIYVLSMPPLKPLDMTTL